MGDIIHFYTAKEKYKKSYKNNIKLIDISKINFGDLDYIKVSIAITHLFNLQLKFTENSFIKVSDNSITGYFTDENKTFVAYDYSKDKYTIAIEGNTEFFTPLFGELIFNWIENLYNKYKGNKCAKLNLDDILYGAYENAFKILIDRLKDK